MAEADKNLREVRVTTPGSTFYDWKGKVRGLMTPEDHLFYAINFPTLEGPVFFRGNEFELVETAEKGDD